MQEEKILKVLIAHGHLMEPEQIHNGVCWFFKKYNNIAFLFCIHANDSLGIRYEFWVDSFSFSSHQHVPLLSLMDFYPQCCLNSCWQWRRWDFAFYLKTMQQCFSLLVCPAFTCELYSYWSASRSSTYTLTSPSESLYLHPGDLYVAEPSLCHNSMKSYSSTAFCNLDPKRLPSLLFKNTNHWNTVTKKNYWLFCFKVANSKSSLTSLRFRIIRYFPLYKDHWNCTS